MTDPTTGVAFPGNIVPASRIDPNGLALLNVFPLPNASNSTAYNYVNQTSTKQPVQLATLKLDFNVRPSDIFSVTLDGDWQTATGRERRRRHDDYFSAGENHRQPQRRPDGCRTLHAHLLAHDHQRTDVWIRADRRPDRSFPQNALASIQRSTYGFNAGQLNPASNPLDLLPGMSFAGVTDPPNIDLRRPVPVRQHALRDRRRG